MKENKNIYLAVAATAIVVGGIGFVGGMKYQQSKQPSFELGARGQAMMQRFDQRNGNGTRQGQGQGAGQGMGQGMRPVVGEIISQDDKSITVKAQDGSSKIVIFSDNTEVNKASEAATSDLKIGETVNVFGTTNSDGSVTAQNIQLNPMFRQQEAK